MVLSRSLFRLVLAYAYVAGVFSWNYVSKNEFETTLNENRYVLAAFVAPWTKASKALEREWNSASKEIKIPLISIDCTTDSELCKKNDITSYPAIRLFNGVDGMARYRGPREASSIISFMKVAVLPVISILDKKNITAFKSISDTVFIGYLNPEDADMKSTFTEFATRNHHRFAFGIATSYSIAKADNVPVPSIVCYKIADGEQETLSGHAGIADLEEFMERATKPPIEEMTRRNELKYLNAGKSILYIFTRTSGERIQYNVSLRALARKYQEYISFVTIDALEYGHMMPALGLQEGVFPALTLQNPMFGQAFPFDQQAVITVEAVEAWIADIAAGRVSPFGSEADGEGKRRDEL